MASILTPATIAGPLLRKVEAISGQNTALCYQCGKCSATCPQSDRMDLMPHQIVRYIQLGFEQVLDAKAPWLCATCFSCKTQCPRGVDVSKICEALRVIKLRQEPIELRIQPGSSEIPQQGLVSAYRKLSSY